jgi:hypothetical protein
MWRALPFEQAALAQVIQNPYHHGRGGSYIFSYVFLGNAGVFRDEFHCNKLLWSESEWFHYFGAQLRYRYMC